LPCCSDPFYSCQQTVDQPKFSLITRISIGINDIADRWIAKFERGRLSALADLKKKLEREDK
jgi:hypothetical protein